MGLIALFRWLTGHPVHHYHKSDPTEFLKKLRLHRPDKLTIERLHDDLELASWRLTFSVTDIWNDGRRVDHYSIMFSAEFVPRTFRSFIDEAKWDEMTEVTLDESAWFNKRGTIKDPATIVRRETM